MDISPHEVWKKIITDGAERILAETTEKIGYEKLAEYIRTSPGKLAGFLNQGVYEIPKFPNIPYFLTFDAEKELKRRVIEFLIKN